MSQICCGRSVRWLWCRVLSSVSRPSSLAKRHGPWVIPCPLLHTLESSSRTNSCRFSTQLTARRYGRSASHTEGKENILFQDQIQGWCLIDLTGCYVESVCIRTIWTKCFTLDCNTVQSEDQCLSVWKLYSQSKTGSSDPFQFQISQ